MPDESNAGPFKGRTGIARIGHATCNSLAGLREAWRHEGAFRLEVIVAAVMIPLAAWMPVTPVERALLVAAVMIVLVVELINSGIETAIDRIGPERHPLSKRAKDLGSAAVMVALLLCLFVWAVVVWPLVFGPVPR